MRSQSHRRLSNVFVVRDTFTFRALLLLEIPGSICHDLPKESPHRRISQSKAYNETYYGQVRASADKCRIHSLTESRVEQAIYPQSFRKHNRITHHVTHAGVAPHATHQVIYMKGKIRKWLSF